MIDSPNRRGPRARRQRDRRALNLSDSVSDIAARRWARPAFSLLELTLVLAIIAALMGVAAFALLGQGTMAKIRATKASMSILQTSVGQYQLNLSVYPDKLDSLVTAQYVEPKSMLDGWRRPFFFRTPGLGGRAYTLMSGGPDGDLNTPADNIDVWTMDAAPPAGGQ